MPKISEDLIGHTTFATSEERRISLLIGRTDFVTSEKFRIYLSRRATGVQENNNQFF